MDANVSPGTVEQAFTNEFRHDERLLNGIMAQLAAWRQEVSQIPPDQRTAEQSQRRRELQELEAAVDTVRIHTRQRAEARDTEIAALKARSFRGPGGSLFTGRGVTSVHP